MGNKKDTTFKKFLTGRKSYREGVEALTFPAYSKMVTLALHDTTKLMKLTSARTTSKQVAVQQHALDLIASSQRAVDIRNRTFMDYVKASRASRPMIDTYEASRLARYDGERF